MRSTSLILAIFAAAANAQPQPALQPGAGQTAMPQFNPELPPGYVLIEGDIQIRLDQYLQMIGGAPPEATFGSVSYWPNGVVPFDFVLSGNGSVSTTNQARAIAAMNRIEGLTGLDFRPATGSDTDRVRFQNSTFNSSPVGRQGGTQTINIVSWTNEIIICHELYHSLGFWHEQSRADRGNYIAINADNICGSQISTACTAGTGAGQCCFCPGITPGSCVPCGHNFDVRIAASFWGPYDFDSFMHYGRLDFSCNGQDTITVLPPHNAQWQNVIGQRDHFSKLDELSCRGIYPRVGDRWMRSSVPPGSGTFFLPYNSLLAMYGAMPANGTLFIDPGTYAMPIANVPQSFPITMRATYGPVTLTDAP